MKVFFTPKQSLKKYFKDFPKTYFPPSTEKPSEIVAVLKNVDIIEPNPLAINDFKLCHDPDYVDDIFSLKRNNGFGIKSKEFNETFPYTNGAMYDAAKAAEPDRPTAALVSGFHHSGFDDWESFGLFCTFNGLLITAFKLLKEGYCKKIAIIDCDQHYGNGTDNILDRVTNSNIIHCTFGKYFSEPQHAKEYLSWLEPNGYVEQLLRLHKVDLILYQAGVDVHKDDPYGGVLTTGEIMERDMRMFSIAKELSIPLAWNLAGGYQSHEKVVELHLNTFAAAKKVYNI